MIGDPAVKEPDVVLIGAGIMSATLAVCLKELEPSLNIEMFETLGGPALESSNAWTTRPSAAMEASTFPRHCESMWSSTCRDSFGPIW